MNTKIIVCCHKADVVYGKSPYFPIHVGKENAKVNLDMAGDNTGDHISNKNGSFCEVTGIYWAWKNMKDVDVIGLCHYRRYFDFHKQTRSYLPSTVFKTEQLPKMDFSVPDDVQEQVQRGSVVVAKRTNYPISNYLEYCRCHISDDLRVLDQVIHDTQEGKYQTAYYHIMHSTHKLIHYNMFLMRWKDFDDYCNWLFPILFEVEKRTDISHYSVSQKRIYGYMAERLFNVWLYGNKKSLIHLPVMMFDDKANNPRFSFELVKRTFLNNLSFKILVPNANEF